MELDIEMPEGYEPAEGKQPRHVKVGEYSLDMETLEAKQWNGSCTSFDHGIVLKKKEPEYKVVYYPPGEKLVSINALKDAIELTYFTPRNWGYVQTDKRNELEELLK